MALIQHMLPPRPGRCYLARAGVTSRDSSASLQRRLLLLCLVILCGMVRGVTAEPWDLSTYELCHAGELRGIPSQASGVTFSEETNTIFVVTRKPQAIMEYDLEGEFVREYPWERKLHDPEGITWLHAYTFAIVEEGIPRIAVVDISPWLKDGMETLFYLDLEDQIDVESVKGLEGLAYDRQTGRIFTIQEQDPKMFWAVALDGKAEQMFDGQSLPVRDLSGLYYRDKEHGLFIVSQQDWRVVNVDTQGNQKQVMGIDGQFPEGITFTPDGALMFIIGEPDEIFIYTSTGSCSYTPGRSKWNAGKKEPTGGQWVEGGGWIPLTEKEKNTGGIWVGDKWVSKTEPGGRWMDGTWLPLSPYDEALGGEWVDGIWVRNNHKTEKAPQVPPRQPPPPARPPLLPPPLPVPPASPPRVPPSPPPPDPPQQAEASDPQVAPAGPTASPVPSPTASVPRQSPVFTPDSLETNAARPITLTMNLEVIADSTFSNDALAQLLRTTLAEIRSGEVASLYSDNVTKQLTVQAEAPAASTSTGSKPLQGVSLAKYLYIFTVHCKSLEDSRLFAESVRQLSNSGELAQQLARKAGSKTVVSVRVVGESVVSTAESTGASRVSLLVTVLCGAGLPALVVFGVVVARLRYSRAASPMGGKPASSKASSFHTTSSGHTSCSGSSVLSMELRGMCHMGTRLSLAPAARERDPNSSSAGLMSSASTPGHSRSPSMAEQWAPACHAGAQHMYWTPSQIWHHRRPSELENSRKEAALEGSVQTPSHSQSASMAEDKGQPAHQQMGVGSPHPYPNSPEQSVHEIRLDVNGGADGADEGNGSAVGALGFMGKWMGLGSWESSHGGAANAKGHDGCSLDHSVIEKDEDNSFIVHPSGDGGTLDEGSVAGDESQLEGSVVEHSTAVGGRPSSLGLDDTWLPPPPAAETPKQDTSEWVNTQREISRHRRTGSDINTSRASRVTIVHRRGDSSVGDLLALHRTLSSVPSLDDDGALPAMGESEEAHS